MIYETVGVMVEGVGQATWQGGVLLLLGSKGLPSGYFNTLVYPNAIVAPPNLSAIGLDPLTGAVRSGALTVQLNASVALCSLFARQARARKVDAVLNADVTSTATTADMSGVSGAINPDDLLYLNDELIRVVSLSAGTVWNIERAYAGTQATGHRAGSNMYRTPPYWLGRAITIYRVELEAVNQTVQSIEAVWRGYLSEPPSVENSVTTITLRAEDALSTLRRAAVNLAPLRHAPAAPVIPFRAPDGAAEVYGFVPAETGVAFDTSVHRRFSTWISDGACKALQLGQSLVITRGDVIVRPGRPILGSTAFKVDELVEGPYCEVALFSRSVDEWLLDEYGAVGPTPTINCAYPYHPLTIAAALLFSDPVDTDEDPLAYNVLHQSCTLGVGYLANYTAWDNLIQKTSHIEVDRLVLFWDMEPLEVFEFLTQQLLPAYGFVLAADASGLLRPIQIGLADVEQYANAPQVTPISGTWEWTLSAHGALDAIDATIGELPWSPGRRVEVSAKGVRDPSSGSRTTRMAKRADSSVSYPTISEAAAESYGAARLANVLAWRYDGLPIVTCLLQADQPWFLGQYVRLLKPAGLVSPILFDLSGQRVDTLWDTAALIGQIIKLRRDLSRNRYEVELLLTNYSYGKAAKWRAPAARIKSRTGSGTYLIEGSTSDFGEAVSDALSLAVGDDVVPRTPTLGNRGTPLARSIVSITPSGPDWLITLSAEFSSVAIAGDWIYLADSVQYLNGAIVAGEDFPYTFMTTGASLPRPTSPTDPDEYS